jgi:hypothetical protein
MQHVAMTMEQQSRQQSQHTALQCSTVQLQQAQRQLTQLVMEREEHTSK